MKLFFTNLLLSFSFLALVGPARAQSPTTLVQGDISIIGICSNAPKGLSFVTWVTLGTGTEIRFTDNGFYSSSVNANAAGNVRWQETVLIWTATTTVNAGSVVKIEGETANTGTANVINSNGSDATTIALSNTSGDQVFAYQGPNMPANLTAAYVNNATFNNTILAGIGFPANLGVPGWSTGTPTGTATSFLPLDLLPINTIYLGTLATGGQYTGLRTGLSTPAGYKALIADISNWTPITGTLAAPTYILTSFALGSPPSISGQPSSPATCAGGNTSMTVTASDATGYQWQLDNGSGFANLSNGGVYSGVNTSTLTITGATAGLNSFQYRCIVTGSGMPATSDNATLTVNVAPTVSSNPSTTSVCAGSNVNFTVTVSNATSYQWQENTGAGYLFITNAPPYSGAHTATLTIAGVTAGMNGYLYRCIATGSCTPAGTSAGATLSVTSPGQWLGTASTLWSNPANWGCGSLPTSSTDVVINSGGNQPVVDIPGAVCNDITINSGAAVNVTSGNTLDIKGAVTGTGTFTVAGRALFSGTAQTIPAGSFTQLEIAGSGTKTLAGNVTVSTQLTLTSGFIQLDSHTLSVGASGIISGGSASSFVVTNSTGSLKQAGIGAGGRTSSIVFPIGLTSSSYTPVALSNPSGTSDEFSARVISGVNQAYDNNDNPTGISQTSFNVDRTWLVSETTPGGSNVTLTFRWNLTEEQPGFLHNSCFAGHYTEGLWQRGPTGLIASGSGPYNLSMNNITSFSPFAVGSPGSTLPLTLLSFTGQLHAGTASLQWQTADETNVATFEVQKSTDGSTYTNVGSVSAVNSAGTHLYSFSDPAVTGPVTYYRLKQIDRDDHFTYSASIALSASKAAQTTLLYPNPSTGPANLSVTIASPAMIHFSLSDNTGQTIRQWQRRLPAGRTILPIQLDQLAPGIYYLNLLGPGFPAQLKLIKQ